MTNIVEFEGRESVERQAREWLIRFDGDTPLTDEEVATLRAWMTRSPVHRQELTRICSFWSQANVLTELAIPLEPADRVPQRRGTMGLRLALTAAAALACVTFAWWWLQRSYQPAEHTYATALGEQKTIFLADGSSIALNTDTRVDVLYSGTLRSMRLLQGEALFSATHDANRPFEVYVSDRVIRAIGTAFAVHLEGNKVDLTVTKGVVEVADLGTEALAAAADIPATKNVAHRPASAGRLKAGETTVIGGQRSPMQVQHLAEPELQRRMAWQEGYLVFSGQPLQEVVEQLNRYSPVTLTIDDPRIAAVAIGGRFRIGDLEAILDVLHTNFGIQSHQVDPHSIRLESESRHP
jgi:transmembrane sensor